MGRRRRLQPQNTTGERFAPPYPKAPSNEFVCYFCRELIVKVNEAKVFLLFLFFEMFHCFFDG